MKLRKTAVFCRGVGNYSLALPDSFDAHTRRARPSRSPRLGVFAFLAEPPPPPGGTHLVASLFVLPLPFRAGGPRKGSRRHGGAHTPDLRQLRRSVSLDDKPRRPEQSGRNERVVGLVPTH